MSVYTNQTNANANKFFFATSGGGGVPDPLTVSTINAQTVSTSNFVPGTSGTPNLVVMDNYMLVQSNSQGGRVSIRTRWDATDSGAVVACVMGSDGNTGTAFVGSEWPGFITMPMAIYGATVEIESDNETFLFMDGKAGALGSISTGTPFLSGSNLFSSITTPGGNTANTTALFSTLKSLYPSNFL